MTIEAVPRPTQPEIPEDMAATADRLADLGVTTFYGALERLGYSRSCPDQFGGGSPDSRINTSGASIALRSPEDIKQNNDHVMQALVGFMVRRAQDIIAATGNKEDALRQIRIELDRRNRERKEKRLPPYPVTAEDIITLATIQQPTLF